MIENQRIKHERCTYEWIFDLDENSADDSWQWMDVKTFIRPSSITCGELNQRFFDECLPQMIPQVEPHEAEKFADALSSMGAKRKQIAQIRELATDAILAKYGLTVSQRKSEIASGSSPFDNVVMRDWFFETLPNPLESFFAVGTNGSGPFEEKEFRGFLARQGIWLFSSPVYAKTMIVGREYWDEQVLDDLIDARVGEKLKVYSQEMFLSFLATGSDPFDGPVELLDNFRHGHKALDYVSQGWPDWVSTFVPHEGSGSIQGDWPTIGLLKYMGYTVGANGLSASDRRDILRKVFTEDLPNVMSQDYMAEWSEPESPARLRKMASSIASFCRNGKKKRKPPCRAIEDWEEDLDWLNEFYYVGHFRFSWPNTYV